MLIVDAVTRLLPGSLGNEASSQNESFSAGVDSEGSLARNISRPEDAKIPTREGGVWGTQGPMLDFPHYTRPAEYRGWKVPDVLIGGNHAEVAAWRKAAAFEKLDAVAEFERRIQSSSLTFRGNHGLLVSSNSLRPMSPC